MRPTTLLRFPFLMAQQNSNPLRITFPFFLDQTGFWASHFLSPLLRVLFFSSFLNIFPLIAFAPPLSQTPQCGEAGWNLIEVTCFHLLSLPDLFFATFQAVPLPSSPNPRARFFDAGPQHSPPHPRLPKSTSEVTSVHDAPPSLSSFRMAQRYVYQGFFAPCLWCVPLS